MAESADAAYVCPRGHRHYEGSAFCTVCGAGPVLEAPAAANVADPDAMSTMDSEWDEWISLFANRNEVAEEYARWLRAYGKDWTQSVKFNEAILRRWSPAGLRYIKERAWKITTQNL